MRKTTKKVTSQKNSKAVAPKEEKFQFFGDAVKTHDLLESDHELSLQERKLLVAQIGVIFGDSYYDMMHVDTWLLHYAAMATEEVQRNLLVISTGDVPKTKQDITEILNDCSHSVDDLLVLQPLFLSVFNVKLASDMFDRMIANNELTESKYEALGAIVLRALNTCTDKMTWWWRLDCLKENTQYEAPFISKQDYDLFEGEREAILKIVFEGKYKFTNFVERLKPYYERLRG